jgi:signal transduction histidine kinase
MRWPARLRSLQGHYLRWVVLPLAVVMMALIVAGLLAYQQIVTSLIMDRDRQLATLTAAGISEVIEGYAHTLETLAASSELQNPSVEKRTAALRNASGALAAFDVGVILVDQDGRMLAAIPDGGQPMMADIAGDEVFQAVQAQRSPVFGNVITDTRDADAEHMVVVAVPVRAEGRPFQGALLGAFHLKRASMIKVLKKLITADESFAYLVDRRGRVLFHPNPREIGADYSDRFQVEQVVAGGTGASLWTAPSGTRYIQGYAPVMPAGWGLIAQERWDAVIAPVQINGAIFGTACLIAIIMVAGLSWNALRRVTAPIKALAEQAERLAKGIAVRPTTVTGISELDALESQFAHMAAEIAAARTGMRRYVGAITQSQEEERRRIARELHDETIQNLITIARRLELYQSTEGAGANREGFIALQMTINGVIDGVRRISRDLRPPVLEILGLIPALQNLTTTNPTSQDDGLHIQFDVNGTPEPLGADLGLALYRIAQESLNNIRKHAHATQVWVNLTFEPATVSMEVRDDGAGFVVPEALDRLAQTGNFGLMGIQERAWAMGGLFSIQSEPGHGTRLRVTFPLQSALTGALYGP